MHTDPTGESWLVAAILVLAFTPVGGIALQVATSILSYVGIAVASTFDEEVKNDMNAIGWNPFNTDESATLNSNEVSFYKGVPVFRTDMERSGSFGAIFLSRGYTDEIGVFHPEDSSDTVKHEIGHNCQLMMMGIGTYGLAIAIPSALKLGPWAAMGGVNYYRAPWEITADLLGGASRTHTDEDIANGKRYLKTAVIFFPMCYSFIP